MLTCDQHHVCVHPVLASVCKHVHLNLYRGPFYLPTFLTCLRLQLRMWTCIESIFVEVVKIALKRRLVAYCSCVQLHDLPCRSMKQVGTSAWMPFGPEISPGRVVQHPFHACVHDIGTHIINLHHKYCLKELSVACWLCVQLQNLPHQGVKQVGHTVHGCSFVPR